MSRNRRRSPLRPLVTLLLVLVVAAIGFGGYLYLCAQKVGTHIDAATTSYEQCLAQMEAQQYQEALVSIRTTADEIVQVREGLEGWQWDVAGKLPYLSQDVSCARQTAAVADELASNALVPTLEQAEGIMGDVSSDNPLATLPDAFAKLPTLYTTVTNARQVVATCKAQADALPSSHFEQLNTLVANVQTASADAEELFASFDPLFATVDTLGGLAGMLTAPTTSPTTSA